MYLIVVFKGWSHFVKDSPSFKILYVKLFQDAIVLWTSFLFLTTNICMVFRNKYLLFLLYCLGLWFMVYGFS